MKRANFAIDSHLVEYIRSLLPAIKPDTPLSTKMQALSNKNIEQSIELSEDEVEIILDILPPPKNPDDEATQLRAMLLAFATNLESK